jgi:quercetin dioxygenase-like cupin family protein
VVVCLRGEIDVRDTLSPPGSPALPVHLSPWLALRASSVGVELSCEAGECRAMFALIAPHSTLQSALRSPPTTAPRATPLEVRAFQDAAAAPSNHGKNHARVLFGGDATKPPAPFSLTLLQTDGPARIAPHTHGASWESLLVLEAEGDLELRGRSYPITGGESLHIAPGVRHAYVARGQTRFVALQLYTPAGPEQRFLAPPAAAAADGRVPPEPP